MDQDANGCLTAFEFTAQPRLVGLVEPEVLAVQRAEEAAANHACDEPDWSDEGRDGGISMLCTGQRTRVTCSG
jgi:hypothetical protein